MLGMQKQAELTGGWAAKDWSWHKYRNSCGEAGEAAKLQALRQSCDLFSRTTTTTTTKRTCDSRAKPAKCALAKHRPKKKEARIIGGPKMGPSQKPPNLAPFFWPRPHGPQLGFGSALGGYHNEEQDPPGEVINPVVTVHTRGPKRNQRTWMLCGIVPTDLFKKLMTHIPPFCNHRFFLGFRQMVPAVLLGFQQIGTGGSLSRPFGGTRMGGSFDFGTFSTLEWVIINKIRYPPNTRV
jgi:hypothetical protein